ncbi:MAG: hypothetical protein J0I69_02965 [Altererythrobacter sp.]|nr:hypothetical protein [Altererythrobacter sp.]OJU60972.1 MAG: hypothetical protein BGO08_12675 [Altererythrobacter sp. 66-12]
MSGREDAIARLERLADRFERLVASLEAPAPPQTALPRGMHLFKCWNDAAVRERVIMLRGKMTLQQAVAELRSEFGPERSPSQSQLHRIWQRLDQVRAAQ